MARPPDDVEPSELFRKLSTATPPSVVVDVPRRNSDGKPVGKIRIQVLRMEQHDEARAMAIEGLIERKLTAERVGAAAYDSLLGDAAARELLAMACVSDKSSSGDPDAPLYGRVFRSAKDVNQLTADEVSALFGYYCWAQKRFGPYESSFESASEVNAWVTRLQEGASSLPLGALLSLDVQELTASLAERAWRLSEILNSPRESWLTSLESIPASWRIGTFSSTEPASEPSPSGDEEVITAERALQIAKRIRSE